MVCHNHFQRTCITAKRTKTRAKQVMCFFLLFFLSLPSFCKSMHAAQHLDYTLGQRYEPNFKRQSRGAGTPARFHFWQDQLGASVPNLILISCTLYPVGSHSEYKGGVKSSEWQLYRSKSKVCKRLKYILRQQNENTVSFFDQTRWHRW